MLFSDSLLTLIEISNRCNLRCTYCANRTRLRPTGTMELHNFGNVLEQLLGFHGELAKEFRIALHGFGEPAIVPNLGPYLRALDDLGFSNVDFTTNGQLLDRIVDDICAAKCLSWVRVSLQSCRKKTMERLNVGARFERVLLNTKILIGSNPPCKVVVQHLDCPDTADETDAEFIRVIGNHRDMGKGKWTYARKKLHAQCGQAPEGPATRQTPCAEGYGSRLIIHWDGNLVGCCSDNTARQPYGNAFADGIFSRASLEARARLADEFRAKDLSHLPLCRLCKQP